MGMFDYIICEVPLPDGFDGLLQTKDFDDPYMEKYTINSQGRLIRHYIASWDDVPEEQWKYVGATDPLHQLWHEQSKRKPIFAEVDTNYHGMLNFYGGEQDWHEYDAKFTDGNLVEIIKRASPSPIEERSDTDAQPAEGAA